MAPISDDRERSFEKALARHFRAGTQAGSATPRPCGDFETLAAYHEGGLAREEMSSWKAHVEDCARCREILKQLAATEEIPLGAAREAAKGKAAGVAVLKPRSVAWRWAAPAGALAAGLLVWVAVRESKPISVQELRKDAGAAKASAPKPAEAENLTSNLNERLSASTGEVSTSVDALKQERGPRREAMAGKPAPKPTPPRAAAAPENALTMYPGALDKSEAADKVVAREFEEKAPAFVSSPMVPLPSRGEPSSGTAVAAGAAPAPGMAMKKARETQTRGQEGARQQQELSGMSKFKENQAMVLAKSVSGATVTAPHSTVQWRVGAAGIIEHSSDAGATWSLQTSGTINDLLAGSAVSDQVCWIVGRAGTILRTTDGGAHWVKVRPPIVDDFASVFAVDARQATVSPAKGTYQTTDGGATWSKLAAE